MSVRVRFAPSPTGSLHIGGARTALFNWLYARHTGGAFILRVEDTDEARNTREARETILESLRWLGLDWDEGPASADLQGPDKGDRGPYFQSRRTEIYRKRVQELIDKGAAYEDSGPIKFRMTREPVIIPDIICGEVKRELTDREEKDPDFVIVRSDGKPVFHLVNVIDDIEMGVTHVIRGEDHLSNTSRHIALYRAFGVEPPRFAHIPLILNANGSKMSKRDEGASMTTYIKEGYVPEAVINYLALLGWSPKDDSQILSVEELIRRFDLPQILRSNAKFDLEKMKWVNFEHIRRLDKDRFRKLGVEALAKAGIDTGGYDPGYVDAALETCREKIKKFNELPPFAGFYFREDFEYDPEAAAQIFTAENKPRLERLRQAYAAADPFNADTVQSILKSLAKELDVKVGVLVHPARLACTGSKVGPSLYHLMEILGREKVLRRFDRALAQMGSG